MTEQYKITQPQEKAMSNPMDENEIQDTQTDLELLFLDIDNKEKKTDVDIKDDGPWSFTPSELI